MSNPEIALALGVSPSTVYRFLEKHSPEQRTLQTFIEHRADIFADFGRKALDLQKKIIDSLSQDGVLDALTPSQKAGIMQSLNIAHGTIYDKERLERGKSTENHSVLHRVMGKAVDGAFSKPAKDKGEGE
jgi:predicted transcriptional regulator YheO